MIRKSGLVVALFGSCFLTGLAVTQQAGAPPTPPAASAATQQQNSNEDKPALTLETPTVLKVTTRLVVIDVVATDRKGEPITDLKQEDLTLLENGTEQTIRSFSFQHPIQGTAADSQSPPVLPQHVFSNAPRNKSEGAATVLLIDGLNTKLSNQAYAREQLIMYLEKLPDNHRVAVFLLGSRLQLLQDFTNDSTALRNAVKHVKDKASPVLEGAAGGDTSTNLGLPSGSALEFMPPQMIQRLREFERENQAAQTDLRITLTLDALNALARTLAGYPGRKNLVWLSESFPLAIVPDAGALKAQSSSTASGMPLVRNYSADVARTASLLTDAQIAVYPVDARGLVNSDVYSSLSNTSSSGEYLGRTATGRSANSGNGSSPGLGSELDRTSEELLAAHSAMGDLADSTGGKAYYNRNDVEHAIQKSIDDGSTYYTLAYYPKNKDWDGRFRKISVKTSRSHVKLRYRQGYYAIDPQAYSKQDPNVQAAEFGRTLGLDYPLATALHFEAEVIPPSEKTKFLTYINYMIDPHALSFELRNDGLQYGSVDCAVQVFSVKGQPVYTHGNTMTAQLKPEVYQQVMARYFPCQQVVDLKPGDYILRLGVRDGRTGLIGTLNAQVKVPLAPAPDAENKAEGKRP